MDRVGWGGRGEGVYGATVWLDVSYGALDCTDGTVCIALV